MTLFLLAVLTVNEFIHRARSCFKGNSFYIDFTAYFASTCFIYLFIYNSQMWWVFFLLDGELMFMELAYAMFLWHRGVP